jgi:hypothetical protein
MVHVPTPLFAFICGGAILGAYFVLTVAVVLIQRQLRYRAALRTYRNRPGT